MSRQLAVALALVGYFVHALAGCVSHHRVTVTAGEIMRHAPQFHANHFAVLRIRDQIEDGSGESPRLHVEAGQVVVIDGQRHTIGELAEACRGPFVPTDETGFGLPKARFEARTDDARPALSKPSPESGSDDARPDPSKASPGSDEVRPDSSKTSAGSDGARQDSSKTPGSDEARPDSSKTSPGPDDARANPTNTKPACILRTVPSLPIELRRYDSKEVGHVVGLTAFGVGAGSIVAGVACGLACADGSSAKRASEVLLVGTGVVIVGGLVWALISCANDTRCRN